MGIRITHVIRCDGGDVAHGLETETRFVTGTGRDNPYGLSTSSTIYTMRKRGWGISGSYRTGFTARCEAHRGKREKA